MEKHGSDERILANDIKNGKLPAFTRLYETHHRLLFHFSLKFLKSSVLAEEAVHDVFLKLWENRSSIDPELSLKAYLLKMCKNHVFNLLKKASRDAALMNEIRHSLAQAGNPTEEAVFGNELEQIVNRVIGQLPAQRQRIFRMYRFEEMDLDAIAGQLHISKGTVKDHLAKANRFVRQRLQTHAGIFSGLLLWGLFLLL